MTSTRSIEVPDRIATFVAPKQPRATAPSGLR
jgi:hypothetical protein